MSKSPSWYKNGTKQVIPVTLHLASKRQNRQQNIIFLPAHVSIKQSGIFQFRYVFPEPLRAIVGKRELKISLGKDYKQMQEAAWRLNAAIKLLITNWKKAQQEMTEDERIEQLSLSILNNMFRVPDDRAPLDRRYMLELMSAQSAKSLTSNVQSTIATLLQDARLSDVRNAGLTPEYLQGIIAALSKQSKPGITLSQLLDKWIESKIQSKKSDKSLNAYQTTKEELIWAFGTKKEAANISSDDIKDV